MIELIATISIVAFSVLLFGYWFRYTCLLILSAKTSRDYAADVATANRLAFPGVQTALASAAVADLDGLRAALDRDYAVLTYLLKNASDATADGSALEKRMLEINYRVMGAWYSVSSRFSPQAARNALDEMSAVVAHFANSMGERAAVGAAA